MVDRRQPTAAPTRELLAHFDALHVEFVGERAVFSGAKDAKIVAELFHSHGAERVKALMRKFFETDSEFVAEVGYSVGVFRSQMARLMAADRKRPAKPHLVSARDWADECRVMHGGRCTNVHFHEAKKLA